MWDDLYFEGTLNAIFLYQNAFDISANIYTHNTKVTVELAV